LVRERVTMYVAMETQSEVTSRDEEEKRTDGVSEGFCLSGPEFKLDHPGEQDPSKTMLDHLENVEGMDDVQMQIYRA
jgi:hypothetical protein